MISITSPTRVDLAGGTLDFWPIHLFVGDVVTVNLAINIFSKVELVPKSNDVSIELEVRDLNFRMKFKNLREVLSSQEPSLLLVQAILNYFKPTAGFRLITESESPVGAGLGGSSSLCISLIRAFLKWNEKTMSTKDMVELAHNIEAQVLKKPTGTQDYVPAIEGGLKIIHYTAEGMRVETVNKIDADLSKQLILVYTGKAHHSGINNWQVIKAIIDGEPEPLSALKELAHISNEMAVTLRKGIISNIPDLFKDEFIARVKLSAGFSSPEIEILNKLALNNGAKGLKICGAGGGGSVLLWAEPESHVKLSELCREKGFRPIPIRAV